MSGPEGGNGKARCLDSADLRQMIEPKPNSVGIKKLRYEADVGQSRCEAKGERGRHDQLLDGLQSVRHPVPYPGINASLVLRKFGLEIVLDPQIV